jgi:hypothetical protein
LVRGRRIDWRRRKEDDGERRNERPEREIEKTGSNLGRAWAGDDASLLGLRFR